ncbi:hypothetical protein BDZ90DRAFT_258109 [Jaminaea rosea]|uniref:Uncharacterized protein n=1 Tax=Jaminaea rosea TaxID=1569628 RepID=A0A316V3G1_9BASI|nr:hypothetical protein BDZ90DRAFT_258109 [Jaminaea rosea]PWN31071.1 hypothetical protein BDZ90DRAFT_258109 [Jaminaea rosea]
MPSVDPLRNAAASNAFQHPPQPISVAAPPSRDLWAAAERLEPAAVRAILASMKPAYEELVLAAAAKEDHEQKLGRSLDRLEAATFKASFLQVRLAYSLASVTKYVPPDRSVAPVAANTEPMIFGSGRWSGKMPKKFDWSDGILEALEDLWHVFSENEADGLRDITSFLWKQHFRCGKATPGLQRDAQTGKITHVLWEPSLKQVAAAADVRLVAPSARLQRRPS